MINYGIVITYLGPGKFLLCGCILWFNMEGVLQIVHSVLMATENTLFITKQNMYQWENLSISLSVHPSVRLSVRLPVQSCRSISFLLRDSGISYITQRLLIPCWYVIKWPKVFWAGSRSLEGKVQSLCLDYISLIKKHWTFLLHIKIAYDVRSCHEVDPGSVQGHCLKTHKSYIGHIMKNIRR